jgi:hypothetical protein
MLYKEDMKELITIFIGKENGGKFTGEGKLSFSCKDMLIFLEDYTTALHKYTLR